MITKFKIVKTEKLGLEIWIGVLLDTARNVVATTQATSERGCRNQIYSIYNKQLRG